VRERGRSTSSAPLVLAPFSTRLPPELLERLRIAAPQLGLRQGEIAATAIDHFLKERGF
jgi:predicted DNA-binding protein